MSDLGLCTAVGGIVGANASILLPYWPEAAADPERAPLAWIGRLWYGGFVASALTQTTATGLVLPGLTGVQWLRCAPAGTQVATVRGR